MACMDGHLITIDGTAHDVSLGAVRTLHAEGGRFWLDATNLDQDEAHALLAGVFGFHPLAVEDAVHFGQRPKVDAYDDFALLVVFGATAVGALVEVHCFYTERFLVTVHRDPCPALDELATRLSQGRLPGAGPDHAMLLHRVVDTLVDGYFPVLEAIDDDIDELEDDILRRPTDEQLGALFDLKRSLIALRKVVTPQRDMFAGLLSGREVLPGMTPDAERYFRDLYDHLIRIGDLVDSYRDLVSGALDTHLSTVSNRLNAVMKQLTIIATVFLPLSFLTGFFGQNFGWMVRRLGSLPVFVGLGIGAQLATVVALMVLFRHRGWLSADGTVPASRTTPTGRQPVARERRWRDVRVPGRG